MSNPNKDYFTEIVKQMLVMGVIAVIAVFGIRMLIGMISSSSNELDQNAINDRIKAIETVAVVGDTAIVKAAVVVEKTEQVVDKKESSVAIDGEALYKAKCLSCHATGVAGAPTFGNKEQWAPRIAKGMDALFDTALNGSKVNPVMAAKGGSADLSDEQVKAIVTYMVNNSK